VMIITDRGQTIRTPIEGIRETGRNAQGVKVMRIEDDERVVAIEPINEGQNDATEGELDESSEEGALEAGAEDAAASLAVTSSESEREGDQGSDDGGQEGS